MSYAKLTSLAGAVTLALVSVATDAGAQATPESMGHVNLHGGLGFDAISAGAALNVGVGYRAPMRSGNWYEGAFDVYRHASEDEWSEGNYEGVEKFEFTVVAARFNMLFGYDRGGVHPIVGFGLFAAGVYWEQTENFIGDAANKSFDDFEGTVFGNIFNVGLGMPLGEKAELRVEAPIMVFWGAEGNSVGLPITVSTGIRF